MLRYTPAQSLAPNSSKQRRHFALPRKDSHVSRITSVLHLALLSAIVCLWSTPHATADEPLYSALWGRQGELWSADSRLPDFSYAGYHRGERPLPALRPDCSVKDFGAVGDGQTDDTRAFQRAIERSAGKTILVPPGVYVITDFLYIRTAGTSLKGAGPRQSILRFPTPLNEIKPNWGATTSGRKTSNYSWSGGFVWVIGSPSSRSLAKVDATAKRGELSLRVSDPNAFHVGDEFCLRMSDTREQTLARYLYADDPGRIGNLGARAHISFIARVTKVDAAGKRIQFDRPLRTDVRSEWNPRIYEAASSVEEVGIEDLGFDFPELPYKGHFTELGYNAMAMSGVRNCWARNLWIHNADSGIFLSGANVTLNQIKIESHRTVEPSRKATGHHGITMGGQDNLLSGFEFRTRFMHDITVTSGSAGNVVADGKGLDVCFDHHCYGPHANLFTNVDLGEGSRMFQSGGGAALGRHSAAWVTFWGIRSRRPQTWPEGWGPDLMNLVGLLSSDPPVVDPPGRWFEPLDPQRLQPVNLYEAQLARRLKKDD